MRKRDAKAFFAPSEDSEFILKERENLINLHPDRYVAEEPESEELIAKVWELAQSWGQLEAPEGEDVSLRNLTTQWEPDLLLMDQASGKFAAGAVCFPSSWDPRHTVGKTIHEVHEIVPRLNAQIGSMIEQFLMKLKPGKAAYRQNWGLTRSGELNYHPELKRNRLDASVTLEDVFLRVEQQLFIGIPGGVLMGLRLKICPLLDLMEDPEEWGRCREKIKTMPDDVAEYKGILAARDTIVQAMNGSADGG